MYHVINLSQVPPMQLFKMQPNGAFHVKVDRSLGHVRQGDEDLIIYEPEDRKVYIRYQDVNEKLF